MALGFLGGALQGFGTGLVDVSNDAIKARLEELKNLREQNLIKLRGEEDRKTASHRIESELAAGVDPRAVEAKKQATIAGLEGQAEATMMFAPGLADTERQIKFKDLSESIEEYSKYETPEEKRIALKTLFGIDLSKEKVEKLDPALMYKVHTELMERAEDMFEEPGRWDNFAAWLSGSADEQNQQRENIKSAWVNSNFHYYLNLFKSDGENDPIRSQLKADEALKKYSEVFKDFSTPEEAQDAIDGLKNPEEKELFQQMFDLIGIPGYDGGTEQTPQLRKKDKGEQQGSFLWSSLENKEVMEPQTNPQVEALNNELKSLREKMNRGEISQRDFLRKEKEIKRRIRGLNQDTFHGISTLK